MVALFGLGLLGSFGVRPERQCWASMLKWDSRYTDYYCQTKRIGIFLIVREETMTMMHGWRAYLVKGWIREWTRKVDGAGVSSAWSLPYKSAAMVRVETRAAASQQPGYILSSVRRDGVPGIPLLFL